MQTCHFHFHHGSTSDEKLDAMAKKLELLIHMIASVSDYIAAMQGRVTTMETAEASVLALLSTQQAQLVAIRAELANAGVTPDQLTALDGFLTTLDGDTAKMTAAAVSTGTTGGDTTTPPAGDDSVTAPSGDDGVSAPTGDDSVTAPSGDDSITGGDGDDSIAS